MVLLQEADVTAQAEVQDWSGTNIERQEMYFSRHTLIMPTSLVDTESRSAVILLMAPLRGTSGMK